MVTTAKAKRAAKQPKGKQAQGDDLKQIFDLVKGDNPKPAEALLKAVECGDVELAAKLIENAELDVNSVLDDVNAPVLYTALDNDDLPMIRMLIQKGAEVNKIISHEEEEYTALSMAIRSENHLVVKQLINYHVDVNQSIRYQLISKTTPLMIAVQETEGLIIIKALVKAKAKLDARDGDGQTALMQAVRCGGADAVHFLIQSGASVSLVDNLGQTALMMAKEKLENGEHPLSPRDTSNDLSIVRMLENAKLPFVREDVLKAIAALLPATVPTRDAGPV